MPDIVTINTLAYYTWISTTYFYGVKFFRFNKNPAKFAMVSGAAFLVSGLIFPSFASKRVDPEKHTASQVKKAKKFLEKQSH